MRVFATRVMFAVAPMLFAATAFAGPVPVYDATSATATFVNDFFGSSFGDTFTWSGPLTNGNGGAGTAVTYTTMPTINVPFTFALNPLNDDTGDAGGAAFGNGMNYPSVDYSVYSAGLDIMATNQVTLTPGNLTQSVPATFVGTLGVCSPNNFCSMGGGTFTNVFDVNFNLQGTLTFTFEELNMSSTYFLTTATFATNAPEPGTWVTVMAGLLFVGFTAQYRRRMSSPARVN